MATSNQELFDSINWNNVSAEILKVFAIKTELTFTYDERYGTRLSSGNIIDQCGIFQYAISDCRLGFFGSWLIDKEDDERVFAGNIHLDYPGNGMGIGRINVYKEGTIEVIRESPRKN